MILREVLHTALAGQPAAVLSCVPSPSDPAHLCVWTGRSSTNYRGIIQVGHASMGNNTHTAQDLHIAEILARARKPFSDCWENMWKPLKWIWRVSDSINTGGRGTVMNPSRHKLLTFLRTKVLRSGLHLGVWQRLFGKISKRGERKGRRGVETDKADINLQ